MKDFSKKAIEEFLDGRCEEVYDMPDSHLELMMDNHKCIEYNGTEYFVPEENHFGNEEIYDYLIENYSL